MDILNKYSESKKELDLLSKQVFSLFEENDVYGIIKTSDIKFLELSIHKQHDELVVVGLCDYSGIIPKISFEAKRSDILDFIEKNIIDLWIEISKSIVEKANEVKAKKFMKDYRTFDHGLIYLLISNYEKLSNSGKTDSEIAKIVAKNVTSLMEKKYEKHNQNQK